MTPCPRRTVSNGTAAHAPLDGADGEPHPQRVLIVDDHQDGATTLSLLVKAIGHSVEVAYNGTEALRQARHFRPTVVLLDIQIPECDGYEILQRLRGQLTTQDAIVAAVTGFSQESDRVRAAKAGFDFYFIKPVDLARLQRFLSALPPAP